MKTKRSKNKLLISFSKETIANLNHQEIGNVRGKERLPDGDYNGQATDTNAALEDVIIVCTPAPLFPDWFPSVFVNCT